MLTEGWDANTVTHILGVRAFGTQLLCEQVVGRGLRRVSYEADENGMFAPEYAEVYGVPFSFIPSPGGTGTPQVQKEIHRVVAQPERLAYELTFPHVQGYRYDLPGERLDARFTDDAHMVLSTQEVPTWVEMDPIVGQVEIHRLDDLKARRLQEVAFRVARRTLDRYLRTDEDHERPWLFPQVLAITTRWLETCLHLKDGTFPQMLLLSEWEAEAARKVYGAIVASTDGQARLLPILRPYDHLGSTRYVDFNTTKPVYPAGKSHLNWLVMDSDWEAKVGQVLDELPEVRAWVKNQGLGLRIPYTFEGEAAHYLPDLLVHIDYGGPDPLNLLIEVTGERKKDKAAKVATARDFWVPAINNDGRFGRWAFLEVTDPWDAGNLIHGHLRGEVTA